MTTVSKDEFSLANCSEQVSILKDLLEDDSKELEQYIDAFIEKFQENRYVAAQRNRTALMDPDFISLVVAKGPELLPPEKYLNFVTIFCSIGKFGIIGANEQFLNLTSKNYRPVHPFKY